MKAETKPETSNQGPTTYRHFYVSSQPGPQKTTALFLLFSFYKEPAPFGYDSQSQHHCALSVLSPTLRPTLRLLLLLLESAQV